MFLIIYVIYIFVFSLWFWEDFKLLNTIHMQLYLYRKG